MGMEELHGQEWEKANPQVFWGEIAPCNHLLQVYDSDDVFLDALEEFVCSGFNLGEAIVIVATRQHLQSLNTRLSAYGFDIESLSAESRYIALDAEETLDKFMVNRWPDEYLFRKAITEVIDRAKSTGRSIRVFGEMVAVLWEQGNNGATVRLEHLWNEFCKTETFSLFCAYPRSGFTQDATSSLLEICNAHTRIIGGWKKPSMEIFHRHGGYSAL
jgi:hypothetical protein